MDNGAGSYRRYLNGDEDAFDEIVKEIFDSLVFFIVLVIPIPTGSHGYDGVREYTAENYDRMESNFDFEKSVWTVHFYNLADTRTRTCDIQIDASGKVVDIFGEGKRGMNYESYQIQFCCYCSVYYFCNGF